MTVREAVAEYLQAKHHLSPVTRKRTRLCLSIFASWCETHTLSLEQLRATHIRAYLQALSQHPGKQGRSTLMASSVCAHASTIKAFLAWYWPILGLEQLATLAEVLAVAEEARSAK